MSGNDTLLGRAVDHERDAIEPGTTDDETPTIVPTGGASSIKNTIGGEQVDLDDPITTVTFEDAHGVLSGEFGRPRPRKFWYATQIGQTPQVQLIKHAITQHLTGGRVQVVSDDDLQGPLADFARLVEDIYAGPHYQEKNTDDLITGAVDSMVDAAWAYWETIPSSDGTLPIAAFKPLPPLQVQHNVDDESGMMVDDPAFYHVPYKRSGGQINLGSGDPEELAREQVITMRGPLTAEDDSLYGESLATKIREWLELITDVDVHQKRHYADSQLPAGFLHFMGSLDDDDLKDIEQDIMEVSGDPHELVTVSSEEGASWIPVGDKVADLDAIQQQTWYFKLVLAAAGLNMGEIGIVEGTGFAKELPVQVKQSFKKIAKPYKEAIFGPQNSQALPQIAAAAGVDAQELRIDLERFDPLQEHVENQETLDKWAQAVFSLNEVRGQFGHDADEYIVDMGGNEVDLASTPRYIVDKLAQLEQPQLTVGDGGQASATGDGAPSGDDPVLSMREVGERFDIEDPHGVKRRLDARTKQLDGTIQVESSFLVSTAYDRSVEPPFMQLEFEREGEPNWVYWYADVEEFRFFNFLKASSKGGYFNKFIRDEYPYARVQ